MGTIDSAALSRVFGRYDEVAAAYLFGSVAKGTAGPRSDLDVALIPRGEGLRERKLDILADLVAEGVDDVDLVILDGTDPFLEYVAISPNRLIYSDSDFNHGQAYSRAVRVYLDIEPTLRRQREAFKRRELDD